MEIKIVYGMKEHAGDMSKAVDITKAVSKDGFPTHHNQQLKGNGYFDYSVKEFSFNVIKERFNDLMSTVRDGSGAGYINSGLTKATDGTMRAMRFDWVLIYNRGTNEIITRGFVDEIKNWIKSTPTLKVFPDAVRLKDVMAGDEITDDDGNDPFHIFDTEGTLNVFTIIQNLCSSINTKLQEKGGLSIPFSVNSTSCPPPDDPTAHTTWLGSVLHKRKAQGFTWNLAKMFINAFDGSFIRRKYLGSGNGYEYSFEEKDASIIKRILIHSGQWLSINQGDWINWTFHIPTGMHLSTWSVAFGVPTGINFTTASFDLLYPNGITFSPFSFGITYPSGIDAGFWYIDVSYSTYTVNLGNIVPTVEIGSLTVDLGEIQPHIEISQVTYDLGHIKPELEWNSTSFEVPSGNIRVPSNDFKIPCIGSEHQIYSLSGGGITHSEGYVRSIFPLTDSQYFVSGLDNEEDDAGAVSSLDSVYGDRFDNSGQCDNVPKSKVESFLKNDEDTESTYYRCAFDSDNFNSYFLTKVARGIGGEDWLMSFETPFDFSQKVKYKNKKANEVLKELSIITNRYFFVDNFNVIHFKPRQNETYNPDKEVKRKFFITRTVKIKANEDVEIKVDRLKEDSDGKVSNYGVYMRDSEFEYLKTYYSDLFSGDVITNEFEIVRPTEIGIDSDFVYPELMDMVFMDTNGEQTKLGVCFEVGHGTEKSTSKYVAQFIQQGEA